MKFIFCKIYEQWTMPLKPYHSSMYDIKSKARVQIYMYKNKPNLSCMNVWDFGQQYIYILLFYALALWLTWWMHVNDKSLRDVIIKWSYCNKITKHRKRGLFIFLLVGVDFYLFTECHTTCLQVAPFLNFLSFDLIL